MKRHTALAIRIARLERARRPRALPRMAFALYDHADAVTGFSGHSGGVVDREPGEGLAALTARALATLSDTALYATYPPSVWASDSPVFDEAEPEDEWAMPEPAKPAWPRDLAGIGRVATAEELQRMAVAPRYRQGQPSS